MAALASAFQFRNRLTEARPPVPSGMDTEAGEFLTFDAVA